MMIHDDLDNQIRRALHVEPSPEQLARLERFWTERSRAEHRRRRGWRAAALAATVLVTASVAVWQFRQGPARQAQNADRATRVAPIVADQVRSAPPENTVAIDTEREEKLLSVGRPPTAYERLVFAVDRRDPMVARSPGLAATLDELIEELVRNPDADVEQLIASTDLAADDMERLLLRRLARSTDDKKCAVLQLLAVCGSSQSIPALLRLGRRESFRDAALATTEQIVGIERFAGHVGQSTDQSVRAALVRRLLTDDSEAGLRGYLSLVGNDGTRAEALAVADELPQPPSTALLELLDDEDETVRLSAALVLGHLNGPDVTRALVDRVTQNPAEATEAWIALLACRGELAEEFLAFASRRPQLLVHVNSARVWWARVVN